MTTDLDTARLYTDFQGLEKLKYAKGDKQQASLKEAAKQFESIFIATLMKSMREANAAFKKGNINDSNTIDFYESMHDQQLSTSLSAKGVFGLADIIVRQLSVTLPQNETDGKTTLNPLSRPKIKLLEYAKVQNNPNSTVIASQLASHFEFKSPEDFIEKIMPLAQKFAKLLNLSPKVLMAQAALETGWGQKIIQGKNGQNSFNLFNIKAGASWSKDTVNTSTTEFINGKNVSIKDNFRKYNSFEESFKDYVKHISSNQRYKKALSSAHSPAQYMQHLQEAGYATDPKYADKVMQLLQSAPIHRAKSD